MQKKIYILIGLIILVVLGVILPRFVKPKNNEIDTTSAVKKTNTLSVGNTKLEVEVMRTEQEMEQGLSGRPTLGENKGMLFDFGKSSSVTPAFWMKDMNFNLDFLWIKNNAVIGITPNVPAPSPEEKFDVHNLPTYTPPSAVDSVLEVNAGWAKKNHITVGNAVILNQ